MSGNYNGRGNSGYRPGSGSGSGSGVPYEGYYHSRGGRGGGRGGYYNGGGGGGGYGYRGSYDGGHRSAGYNRYEYDEREYNGNGNGNNNGNEHQQGEVEQQQEEYNSRGGPSEYNHYSRGGGGGYRGGRGGGYYNRGGYRGGRGGSYQQHHNYNYNNHHEDVNGRYNNNYEPQEAGTSAVATATATASAAASAAAAATPTTPGTTSDSATTPAGWVNGPPSRTPEGIRRSRVGSSSASEINQDKKSNHWVSRLQLVGEDKDTMNKLFEQLQDINTVISNENIKNFQLQIENSRLERIMKSEENKCKFADEKLESIEFIDASII
ncbi:hypothetical protein CANARDRAFT_178013 [[Candida] arabinofermentans NRRL YB-2248]|uniref:Transcription regulator LGE1 helical region domain-containing protein n=1 Tax=[Candida] arabinofermentans NRRL YB-2248 TaxID=983967 RepID=A0A1E4SUB3_9ASCO|nr:hypothetical protein CANARDRAFT_178013 [[Candida] arabinofermentans NRRL YB-2248]